MDTCQNDYCEDNEKYWFFTIAMGSIGMTFIYQQHFIKLYYNQINFYELTLSYDIQEEYEVRIWYVNARLVPKVRKEWLATSIEHNICLQDI